jgi:hypothetical protein
MYKFTNGVVVYDEVTRDKYVKAGLILVEEQPKAKEEKEVGEEKIQNKAKPEEYRRTSKRTSRFGNKSK